MKRLSATILILLLPMFGHAALLKYEVEFSPYNWPDDVEYEFPFGNGHVIADTQLNAVVSGELVTDFFHYVWESPAPTPITYGYTYIGGHIVRGGFFRGHDIMSGVAGNLSLVFYLPSDLDNYSKALDRHTNEDVWWDLRFPSHGSPADQWEYVDLWLEVSVFPPTVVNETSVSEPGVFIILSLGLAAVAGTRTRKLRDW